MDDDPDFIMPSQEVTWGTITPRREYMWIILFEWDVDLEEPFRIFNRATLTKGKLSDSWFDESLNDTVRQTKVNIACLSSSPYSVFAKVEKGITVLRLNVMAW